MGKSTAVVILSQSQSGRGAKHHGPHLLNLPRAERCPEDYRVPVSTRHLTRAAGGSKLGALLSFIQLITFAKITPRPLPSLHGSRIAPLLNGFWCFTWSCPATPHTSTRVWHTRWNGVAKNRRGERAGSGKVWEKRR